MADELVAALTQRPMPHAVEHLYLTDPIAGFRPHRRHHVLGRRRRICLRPRDARFRRHGPPPRPRDPRARSMPARCPGRCCPPANASAPPRSAPPNTACSSPAIPATSPSPASCCRAAICRCCSRPSSAARSSMPTALAQGDPRPFHGLRPDRGRGRGGAGACAGRARRPTSASPPLREGIRHGLAEHDRAQEADLHHARRRHRADARRDPARGAAGRERDSGASTA